MSNQIQRNPVESSRVKSLGHDGGTTMHVEFHDGSIYAYDNVNAADFRDLTTAKSIGSHFIRNIKRNPTAFPYRKIQDGTPKTI